MSRDAPEPSRPPSASDAEAAALFDALVRFVLSGDVDPSGAGDRSAPHTHATALRDAVRARPTARALNLLVSAFVLHASRARLDSLAATIARLDARFLACVLDVAPVPKAAADHVGAPLSTFMKRLARTQGGRVKQKDSPRENRRR